ESCPRADEAPLEGDAHLTTPRNSASPLRLILVTAGVLTLAACASKPKPAFPVQQPPPPPAAAPRRPAPAPPPAPVSPAPRSAPGAPTRSASSWSAMAARRRGSPPCPTARRSRSIRAPARRPTSITATATRPWCRAPGCNDRTQRRELPAAFAELRGGGRPG